MVRLSSIRMNWLWLAHGFDHLCLALHGVADCRAGRVALHVVHTHKGVVDSLVTNIGLFPRADHCGVRCRILYDGLRSGRLQKQNDSAMFERWFTNVTNKREVHTTHNYRAAISMAFFTFTLP